MFIVHIVAMVLAVAALPGALLRVLPVQHEAAQRLLPLLMVVTGIWCWYAPVGVVVGVAAVIPASWLAGVLGIQMVPTEPANWTPVKAAARRLAGSIAGTVRQLPFGRHRSPEPEPEIQQFVKPGDAGVLADPEAVVDGTEAVDAPVELEPPAMRTQVPKWVPSLLD